MGRCESCVEEGLDCYAWTESAEGVCEARVGQGAGVGEAQGEGEGEAKGSSSAKAVAVAEDGGAVLYSCRKSCFCHAE